MTATTTNKQPAKAYESKKEISDDDFIPFRETSFYKKIQNLDPEERKRLEKELEADINRVYDDDF